MLAYAPRPASRAGSPRTLLLVAASHALALALLLTARSEYAARTKSEVPDIIFIEPVEPPPPPPATTPSPPRTPIASTIDRQPVITPIPAPPAERVDSGPPVTSIDPTIGTAIVPGPPLVLPQPLIVRTAARFITPADDVRPPYPASKQRLEQEASLRLALAIDPRGRVVSVDPVGRADPAFLDSARAHILRHWRYQPATDGGQAVASRIVITLRFELER